jgi:hypothetical protein
VYSKLLNFAQCIVSQQWAGVEAGDASFFIPGPEPHQNDSATQHWCAYLLFYTEYHGSLLYVVFKLIIRNNQWQNGNPSTSVAVPDLVCVKAANTLGISVP